MQFMPREIRSRRCCDSDDLDDRRSIVSAECEHRDLPARGEIDVLVVETASLMDRVASGDFSAYSVLKETSDGICERFTDELGD
jgi:hypothetical protein